MSEGLVRCWRWWWRCGVGPSTRGGTSAAIALAATVGEASKMEEASTDPSSHLRFKPSAHHSEEVLNLLSVD
jgi:hypothetical protein